MSIFDFLFGSPEEEEPSIEEKIAQGWFSLGIIARLAQQLPFEDLLGADMVIKALDGAQAIHLKGRDVINGLEQDVDIKLELNQKVLLEDGDGDYILLVYGLSELGSYPELCAYWYNYLVPVYKKNNPGIKPSRKAYSFSLN